MLSFSNRITYKIPAHYCGNWATFKQGDLISIEKWREISYILIIGIRNDYADKIFSAFIYSHKFNHTSCQDIKYSMSTRGYIPPPSWDRQQSPTLITNFPQIKDCEWTVELNNEIKMWIEIANLRLRNV